MGLIDWLSDLFSTVNSAMTHGAAVLCVGTVTFGLLTLAMILGSKQVAVRRGRLIALRGRLRFSKTAKWYPVLPPWVQYTLIGAAALVVALFVVVVGGVFGVILGVLVLILSAGLRYWLAL